MQSVTPPDDDRLWPGRLLCDRWRLDACIGKGGMASVWAATGGSGRRAAIKVLHAELSHDPLTRERFRRELYAANRIRHPSVVLVQDDGVTDDGVVFLAMELLDGHNLKTLVRSEGLMAPARVAAIALAVLGGLDVAHAAGVIHRDIKPDNVFLTRCGEVKLLDFGVARLKQPGLCAHHTSTGVMLGTPAFMPPEQALGYRDEIDARCDIFAVGATMWWLLTGLFVHPVATLQELLIASGTEPARPIREVRPSLDPAIAQVIDRALRFDKEQRWPTAGRMRCALAASLEREAPDQAGSSERNVVHGESVPTRIGKGLVRPTP